jgi:nucleoside-triphosphatase
MNPIVLITGRPGSGKTTLVRRVVERLAGRAGGFYTAEIRHGGVRQGFKLITLDGHEAVIAHVEFAGRQRVGKYTVDVAALDRVGVPAVERALAAGQVIVVDEIGPMELSSSAFRTSVLHALDSGCPVLATVMLHPDPWADALKRRPGVRLVELTPANRDRLLDSLVETFRLQET